MLRSIHDRLVPFADTFNWSGVTVTDPNDLGLAMSAATLGLDDESDRYFAAAIDLCERAGERGYLARCHFDWAREHAEIAVEMGTALGMTGPHGVAPRARGQLERT